MKKAPISVSVDFETLELVQSLIRTGKFRNRSHVFEQAVKALRREEE